MGKVQYSYLNSAKQSESQTRSLSTRFASVWCIITLLQLTRRICRTTPTRSCLRAQTLGLIDNMSATEQDIRARLLTTLERLKSMSSIEDLKDFHSDWNMLNEDYENAQVSGELAEETEEIAFSVASCVETICMGLASLSVAVTDEDTVEDHLLFPGSSERTLSPRSALLPKVEDDSEVSLWSTKSLPSTQLALEGHEPSSPSIFMWTENYGSPSVAAQPLTSMLDPRTSYPSPAPSTSPSSSPEPEIFAHSAPQQFMERLDMPNASQGVSSWSLPSPPSSERSASPESARSCSPAPRRRIQKRQLPIPSPSSSERALSSSPSSIYKSTPTTYVIFLSDLFSPAHS